MSRKPKPTKGPAYLAVVRQQESEPAKETARAEGKSEEAASISFEAPHWFLEEDRRAYEYLQTHLKRLGVLDQVDQIELQILARAYGDWLRIQEELNAIRAKNGSLTYRVSGRNGVQHKTYPQVHQAQNYEKIIAAIGSNFGISPVDRERIKFLGREPGDGDQGSLLD